MTPKQSFASQFAALEKIVQSFEHEKMDIERGIEQFEKGVALAEELKKTLASVENKIVSLKERYRADEPSSEE